MKELTTFNWNMIALDGKENVIPSVELVICASEPDYEMSNTGDIVKTRRAYNFRFATGVRGIEQLIQQLGECRDELVAFEKKVCGKK